MTPGHLGVVCPHNCSYHGVCQGNTCTCHVHYTGAACDASNLSYLCVFGSIFYVVALISICQLFFCMRSEYQKKRSLSDSCRVTTQKTLYALTALASIIRGTYFYVVDFIPEPWGENLLAAYYPLYLSCMSLVVCFWAENFHLSDIPCDRPRFLTKSTVSFLFFNFIFYAILTAQFTVTRIYSSQLIYRQYLLDVFKGCFAAFMLIVLIFFLIYGIQVYFKIHGSFREPDVGQIDSRQLCMSRFGLLAEALLLLSIVVRLSLEVGKFISIEYLSVIAQNSLDILFRVVELGAALWFPCVLWNVGKPEQLWILNPKTLISLGRKQRPHEETRLISSGDQRVHRYNSCDTASPSGSDLNNTGDQPIIRYSCGSRESPSSKNLECWICYEGDEPRFGAFIKPCKCRGDTSAVHHKCLQKWLMESRDSPDRLSCGICKEKYNLQQGAVWLPDGLKKTQWLLVTVAVVVMIGAPFFTAWFFSVCHISYVQVIVIGVNLLLEYACLKCQCGNCRIMETAVECRCCQSQPSVQQKLGEDAKCITEHPGFDGVCLNIWALEVAFLTFKAHCRKLPGHPVNGAIHEKYRYVAYRQFVRWCWGFLGKKIRVVIPSCAVLAIRNAFTSDSYKGFKLPDMK